MVLTGRGLPAKSDHSSRNAMIGSTCTARNTGARVALNATMDMPAATAMNVGGSTADMPKSKDVTEMPSCFRKALK